MRKRAGVEWGGMGCDVLLGCNRVSKFEISYADIQGLFGYLEQDSITSYLKWRLDIL
jgi:hypothetical protein